MRRNALALLLFGLFIAQGTVMKWIIPAVWQTDVMVSPQLTLIVILFIGLYGDRHTAMLFGLGFGLLHDAVYYGPMIGTYTFSMGLVGYLAGFVGLRPSSAIVAGLLTLASFDLFFQAILYGLYRLFQITHTGIHWVFFHQMLPTLLTDLLFALLIYVPVRKWLEGMAPVEKPEEE